MVKEIFNKDLKNMLEKPKKDGSIPHKSSIAQIQYIVY